MESVCIIMWLTYKVAGLRNMQSLSREFVDYMLMLQNYFVYFKFLYTLLENILKL